MLLKTKSGSNATPKVQTKACRKLRTKLMEQG